jgi:hypothetical protein
MRDAGVTDRLKIMIKGQIMPQGFGINPPVMKGFALLSKNDTPLAYTSRIAAFEFHPMKGLAAL